MQNLIFKLCKAFQKTWKAHIMFVDLTLSSPCFESGNIITAVQVNINEVSLAKIVFAMLDKEVLRQAALKADAFFLLQFAVVGLVYF